MLHVHLDLELGDLANTRKVRPLSSIQLLRNDVKLRLHHLELVFSGDLLDLLSKVLLLNSPALHLVLLLELEVTNERVHSGCTMKIKTKDTDGGVSVSANRM